ncbi:hypothetical protein [Methylibium sp.]|uniref:hypothetical protein n=1 Tax=Methylibium sp. TaxID=2067992 RepID=UPI003F6FF812
MSGQVQALDEERHRIQDGKQAEGDEVAAMVSVHVDGDASGSIQTVREGSAPGQDRRKCTTRCVVLQQRRLDMPSAARIAGKFLQRVPLHLSVRYWRRLDVKV